MQQTNQQQHKPDPFIGQILFGKYRIVKVLGKGSFGRIYSAEYKGELYAVKLENTKRGYFLLENEARLLNYLQGPRVPYVKLFDKSGFYNILIMQLLGKSLEEIRLKLPSQKFSIPCVCKIAYQIIDVIEYIHNKHYIHRDIKPENFLMGVGNNSKYVYIIDFGLSKLYRDPFTFVHLPMSPKLSVTGTAKFSSINAITGYTQSRRDDLESIGYVLIYLAKGSIPWGNIQGKTKQEMYSRILAKKLAVPINELCNGLPIQFCDYIKYCRELRYEECPNYAYLKNLFFYVLQGMGESIDYKYDWDDNLNESNLMDNNNNVIINNNNDVQNDYNNDKNYNYNNNNYNYNYNGNNDTFHALSIEQINNPEDIKNANDNKVYYNTLSYAKENNDGYNYYTEPTPMDTEVKTTDNNLQQYDYQQNVQTTENRKVDRRDRDDSCCVIF